jgi:hypothetical protein
MSLQEDVQKIEEKVKKVEEQSIVMELLHDQKKQNKRLFIVILVILSMWFATIGAFLYYINTTGYEETTEIAEVENEDGNANACVGDSCNNGEINYGESKSD